MATNTGLERPVSRIVQGIMADYRQSKDAFITEAVLPGFDVEGIHKGTVITIDRKASYGDSSDSLSRAEGAEFHRSNGLSVGSVDYICEEFGDSDYLDRQRLKRSQLPIDLQVRLLQVLTDNVMLKQEIRTEAAVMNSSSFASDTLTGGRQWSDSAGKPILSADPVADIIARIRAVRNACGMQPNTLVFSSQNWDVFCSHPAVLDFLSASKDRHVLNTAEGRALLVDKLEIQNVHVGRAMKNTANLNQSEVLTPVWRDSVFVGVLNSGGSIGGGGEVAPPPTALVRLVEEPYKEEEWDVVASKSIGMRVSHSEALCLVSAYHGGLVVDTQAA